MKFTNIGIEGFKIGISAPDDLDLTAEKVLFKNVETCIEVRKVAKKTSKKNIARSAPDKKVKKDKESNLDINEVIQNLHNLEIQSKINKDFEKLEKIRKLKGLIGSKKFICEYSTLREKG
ncbi:hypothetical protein [Acinetobacter baumannii]|uniref:hypothetical protein n=1 Tax=Acinetobacter baumannii TaxID=470 RepID=UPI00390A1ACD